MAKKSKTKKAPSAPILTPGSSVGIPEEQEGALVQQLDAMTLQTPAKALSRKEAMVQKWDSYFGRGDLEDFQRLCADLMIEGDLSSKSKCRKALECVHVNIPQFLNAMGTGNPIVFFKNRNALITYTLKNRKKRMYPRNDIPQGSPLRKLLRMMH